MLIVSPLSHRSVEIQVGERQQLPIAHLGQIDFLPAAQEILRQLLLELDQRVDSLLDRATANEFVYEDIALLPDAEGAVGRLVFNGGVPPAVEMREVRGGGQIEARSASLEQQDGERPCARLPGTS